MSAVFTYPDVCAAQKVQTLYKVLDWLEAHPDNAITGNDATDDTGFPVAPLDPTATCFCFVGRLRHEVGRTTYPWGLSLWLSELQTDAMAFSTLNDAHFDPAARFAALRAYLNSIAEGVTA